MPPRPAADMAKVVTDDLKPVLQRRPIDRLLVEMGALSFGDLEQLLAFQRHGGGFLGEILLDRGWITVRALVDALSEQIMGRHRLKTCFSSASLERVTR